MGTTDRKTAKGGRPKPLGHVVDRAVKVAVVKVKKAASKNATSDGRVKSAAQSVSRLRKGEVFDLASFGHGDKHQRYGALLRTTSFERIALVRKGVPARMVPQVAKDMGIEQSFLVERLGLARSTLARKVQNDERLSARDSEGVLGAAQLVGLVEEMIGESGGPKSFDAAAWVGEWITRPQPALGNREPAELLDTAEGLQLVMQVLQQSQTGAYA